MCKACYDSNSHICCDLSVENRDETHDVNKFLICESPAALLSRLAEEDVQLVWANFFPEFGIVENPTKGIDAHLHAACMVKLK